MDSYECPFCGKVQSDDTVNGIDTRCITCGEYFEMEENTCQ